MRILTCLTLASLLAVTAIGDEHTTIIHAGTLLAVPGEVPVNNQSIIIEGSRIARVADGFVSAADMSGEVTVMSATDDGEVASFVRGQNELIGEMGLLTCSPRSART